MYRIIHSNTSHLQELDDTVNAEKHLRLLRKNAAEFGFTKRLAQAYYQTGKYFLDKVQICRLLSVRYCYQLLFVRRIQIIGYD